MDTLIINIEEKSKLKKVEDFLKSINLKPIVIKGEKKKDKLNITPADPSVSPFMLFDKWKDINIEARELRESLWQRYEF